MKPRKLLLAALLAIVFVLDASATVLYVDVNSTNPTPPYTSWATAATNIQDAVDAASAGDTVLVTNGVYATGGRVVYGAMTNRVAVTKTLTLQSVNGPSVTVIRGHQVSGTTNGDAAVRCVYLTNKAALIGFTLTNGATRATGDLYQEMSGGAVWCASMNSVISNCWLVCNAAKQFGGGAYLGSLYGCSITNNTAWIGGGARSSMATSCLLSANSAGNTGGGADAASLVNCMLSGNVAYMGGGASSPQSLIGCLIVSNRASDGGGLYEASGGFQCTVAFNSASQGGGVMEGSLWNSICYYNSATIDANYSGMMTISYCCTLPGGGTGNITNAPSFVDLTGGDFHLQTNSPCINAGNNTLVYSSTDLDGNPRIKGGTVDMGAYEFQNPVSNIPYIWLQTYGLPITNNVDSADPDGDGVNNWQEWQAGTVPTNALSVLKMCCPTGDASGITVTWHSVSGKTYYLQQSTNLIAHPAFLSIQSNLVGQAGTTSYKDTTATNAGPYFYRVGLQ